MPRNGGPGATLRAGGVEVRKSWRHGELGFISRYAFRKGLSLVSGILLALYLYPVPAAAQGIGGVGGAVSGTTTTQTFVADLSTANQSMWGFSASSPTQPNSPPPSQSIAIIPTQSWNTSGSSGSNIVSVPGLDEPDQNLNPDRDGDSAANQNDYSCTNFFGPTVCVDSNLDIDVPITIDLDHDSASNNSDQTSTSYGGSISGSTSGQFGLNLHVGSFNSGTVSVNYPVQVTLSTTAPTNPQPGDTVSIASSWGTGAAAGTPSITSSSSVGSVAVDGTAAFSAASSANMCVIACANVVLVPSTTSFGPTTQSLTTLGQGGQIPLFDTSAGLSGTITPPTFGVSGLTSVGAGGQLTASGGGQFLNAKLDVAKLIDTLSGGSIPIDFSTPPLPKALAGVGASVALVQGNAVTLGNTTTSMSFVPDIRETFTFSQPVAWTVNGPAGFSNGDSATVTVPTAFGQQFDTLSFVVPQASSTPLTYTTALTMGSNNQFTNDTGYQFTWYGQVKALSASLSFPFAGNLGYTAYKQNTNTVSINPSLLDQTWALTGWNTATGPAIDPLQATGSGATTTVVVSSVPSSVVGAPVKLVATVSYQMGQLPPTGGVTQATVTFYDGSTVLGTEPAGPGANSTFDAILETSSLSVGTHAITAQYSGFGVAPTHANPFEPVYYPSTSPVLDQVVNPATTTTTVQASTTSAALGQSVTLTANVAAQAPGTGTPSGTVTFYDGSSAIGTPQTLDGSGTAQLQTSFGTVGTHAVSALFTPGNGDYTSPGASAAVDVTVAAASTSTDLSAYGATSVDYGHAVSLTAFVSAPTGTQWGSLQGGTVGFVVDGTEIAVGSIDATGNAADTVTGLPVGPHTLTAVFEGQGNFAGSTSNQVSLQVVPEPTVTTVTSTPPTGDAYGQQVTLTASVATVDQQTLGSGYVTFYAQQGSAQPFPLNSIPVSSGGIASLTTSELPVGTDVVTALYDGTTDYAASTSTGVTYGVGRASTYTTLTAAPSPAVYGGGVALTAQVSSAAGIPPAGDTVTFYDGKTNLGTASTASDGDATLTLPSLAGGNHSLSAAFAGDTTFKASTSQAASLTVDPATTQSVLAIGGLPAAYGQSVTLTATVTSGAGTPDGTVQFIDGSGTSATSLGTAALSGGQAVLTTSSLAAATHAITASYEGNNDFANSSSGQETADISTAPTSTQVSANTTAAVYAQPVTFTAQVTAATGVAVNEGEVTFASGGTASLTTGARPVSSGDTVTATFGDAADFGGSHASITLPVGKATTVTGLTSSAPSSDYYGQGVTFTAQVSVSPPGGGDPSGTVTFYDGTTQLGTGTLTTYNHLTKAGTGTAPSGDTATFTTSTLGVGSGQSITAEYTGTSDFAGSTSGAVLQTVNPAPTAITVGSTVASSVYGNAVTFTAALTSLAGVGVGEGTVTFLSDGSAIGTGTVSGGAASLTTAALPGGKHTITASYTDAAGNFTNSSTQSGLPFTVNPAPTQTGLAMAGSPAEYGQSVTLTATVSSGAGTPAGEVQFTDAGGAEPVSLGTVALSGGQAVLKTATLTVSAHSITASYAGSGDFAASTSNTVGPVIKPAPTTTQLSASVTAAVYGQPVSFTAQVTSATGVPVSEGTVTFVSDGSAIGTGTVRNGTASLTTSALAVSAGHKVTADFAGATDFASSSSAAITLPVGRAATSTTLSDNVASPVYGQPVTFTAQVAVITPGAGTPSGSVDFYDGTTEIGTGSLGTDGQARFTTPALAVGTNHAITAQYTGDGDFSGSGSAAVPVTVNPAATTTTLSSQALTVSMCQPGPDKGRDGGGPACRPHGAQGPARPGHDQHGAPSPQGCGMPGFGFQGFGGDFGTVAGSVYGSVYGRVVTPSGPDTSILCQPVVLTASIAVVPPGVGVPTGTVTFSDGGKTLGTVSVTTANGVGTASLTVEALPAGPQAITATYGGNTDFEGSVGSLTQHVGYIFVGLLPPLDRSLTVDSHQKQLQLAFTLLNAQGQVVPDATATLAVDGHPAVGRGRDGRGDAFRFAGNSYQYNLDLRAQGLTGPTATLTINLSDGTAQTFILTLRTPPAHGGEDGGGDSGKAGAGGHGPGQQGKGSGQHGRGH